MPRIDDFALEHGDGYLRVVFPVYETAEQVRPYVDAALEECARTGVTRVLVDATANSIALSPIEYQRVAQYFTKQPAARILRVALVRRPELVAEAKHFEGLLRTREIRYAVFADTAEAEAWLTSPDG